MKFSYLLQKKLNKNICNINVLIDIFINLYDNSEINCKKKKINYMIYIIIVFLISSAMVINNIFSIKT